MSSFIQSNTQQGSIVRIANADLTGKEGYLAKLVNANGEAKIALAGNGELAQFVILEGGASGEEVVVQPLSSDRNVRIVNLFAIDGGAEVASDTTGKASTAASGDWVVGIAEQDGAAGDYLLIRPVTYKKA